MAEYLWSGQLWRMLVAVTRARHFIEIYGCVSEKSLWVLNVRCLQTLPVKKHMQGSMWPTLLLCLTFLQGQRDLETRRSPQQGDSLLLSGCSYSWTANKQACYIKQLLLRSLCTLTGFFYWARSCYRALLCQTGEAFWRPHLSVTALHVFRRFQQLCCACRSLKNGL